LAVLLQITVKTKRDYF